MEEEKIMFYKVNLVVRDKIIERYVSKDIDTNIYTNNLRYICNLIHQDMYKFFGIIVKYIEYCLDTNRIYIYIPSDKIVSEIESMTDPSKDNILNFLQYYSNEITAGFSDSHFFQIAFYRKDLNDVDDEYNWTYEDHLQLVNKILERLMEENKDSMEVFETKHKIDGNVITLTNFNWLINKEREKKIISLIEEYAIIVEPELFLRQIKK